MELIKNELLVFIKEQLLLSGCFHCGYAPAKKLDIQSANFLGGGSGLVVIETDNGFEYVGPQDTKGDYFYIRTIENKIKFRPVTAKDKLGDCDDRYQADIPIRVVAFKHCKASEISTKMVYDLLNISFRSGYIGTFQHAIDRFLFSLTATNTDFMEVFAQETGKAQMPPFYSAQHALVAIDFNLSFLFSMSKCGKAHELNLKCK